MISFQSIRYHTLSSESISSGRCGMGVCAILARDCRSAMPVPASEFGLTRCLTDNAQAIFIKTVTIVLHANCFIALL